ncbi:MAG: MFS transporter [Candidatus Helarchaeota archaeon]|nr:MFS transporter [Candidatus Helarchaeota archaeon]
MKKTDLIKLSIGQIGNAMAFMVMFLFLPDYFADNIFVGHEFANTLAFLTITISFTAGAITFLIAGYLSDKTKTRWGKRRPYFLLIIPGGIAYMFLGITIPGFSIEAMFAFLSIMATTYAVLYRFEYCAYWALYMDLTEPDERISTSIIFNLFGTIGTLGALLLFPILEKILPYLTITIILGAVLIGTVLFAFFFGPREDLSKLGEETEMSNLLGTLKETASDRNFFFYLLASFFFVLGYSISTLTLVDFLEAQTIDLLVMLPFVIPVALFYFILFSKLSRNRGNLQAFKLAILTSIIMVPFTLFLGIFGDGALLFFQVFLIISIILFVVIAVLTFQYAILMDLAPSGREATYSGVYLFVIVIPIPIASTLAGLILDLPKIFPGINFFIWQNLALSFALIFLINIIFLSISYIFLRAIQE